MSEIEVSVIIPFTRADRVRKAIESVRQQDTRCVFELILVGKKESFVGPFDGVVGLPQERQPLPGEARNIGARHARGKHLLFLDDDCHADGKWMDGNVAFLKTHDGMGAVGGKIVGVSDSYFGLCTDYANFWRQQNNRPRKTDQLYTATLGVKKDVFEAIGGFSETLAVGEDVDFVRRLARSGYVSYYCPDIVVYHDHRRTTLRTYMRYMYSNGRQVASKPRINFLVALPMAAAHGCLSFLMNLGAFRRLIFVMPFVLVGYVAYYWGIASHNREHKNETAAGN